MPHLLATTGRRGEKGEVRGEEERGGGGGEEESGSRGGEGGGEGRGGGYDIQISPYDDITDRSLITTVSLTGLSLYTQLKNSGAFQ